VTYRSTVRQRLKNIPTTIVHATVEGYPLLGNGAVNTVFSIMFDPRLYGKSLFVDIEIRIEILNWEFRGCRYTEE
jgi:hypothetical protein